MRKKIPINITLSRKLIAKIKNNSEYTGESISHRIERLLLAEIAEENNKENKTNG